jgi:hypothetical protein
MAIRYIGIIGTSVYLHGFAVVVAVVVTVVVAVVVVVAKFSRIFII